MTAEEILDLVAKENGYHNYADCLVLGNPHYIRLISQLSSERYARIQIEKDRERLKEAMDSDYFTKEISGNISDVISQTPIILD